MPESDNEYGISLGHDENVLKLDSANDCTTLWLYQKISELYTLKAKF